MQCLQLAPVPVQEPAEKEKQELVVCFSAGNMIVARVAMHSYEQGLASLCFEEPRGRRRLVLSKFCKAGRSLVVQAGKER